jgi:hypothetical protein
LNAAHKVVPTVALLAVLSFSAFASAQTGLGGIGPSGAQVAGAAVGVAAVIGIVLYLTLHKPSITGCIRSGNGTNTLHDQNDNLDYILVDATSGLKPGERVKLLGKKKKDKEGNVTFRVKKLKHDYGPCQQ